MPKTRKRRIQAGAKSIAVRIKKKVGGRKSTKGLNQMADWDLWETRERARPRDRQKITRELDRRIKTIGLTC